MVNIKLSVIFAITFWFVFANAQSASNRLYSALGKTEQWDQQCQKDPNNDCQAGKPNDQNFSQTCSDIQTMCDLEKERFPIEEQSKFRKFTCNPSLYCQTAEVTRVKLDETVGCVSGVGQSIVDLVTGVVELAQNAPQAVSDYVDDTENKQQAFRKMCLASATGQSSTEMNNFLSQTSFSRNNALKNIGNPNFTEANRRILCENFAKEAVSLGYNTDGTLKTDKIRESLKNLSIEDLKNKSRQLLGDLKVKSICYTPSVQREMMCYAIAATISPDKFLKVAKTEKILELSGLAKVSQRAKNSLNDLKIDSAITRSVRFTDEYFNALGIKNEKVRELFIERLNSIDPTGLDRNAYLNILNNKGDVQFQQLLKTTNIQITPQSIDRAVAARRQLNAIRQELSILRTEQLNEGLKPYSKVDTVDCNKVNGLNSTEAFHRGVPCAQVTVQKEIKGEFCYCGGNTGPSAWLSKCTDRAKNFRDLGRIRDVLALPGASEPTRCYRVTIPEGSKCFSGGNGPAFVGLGGESQLYCPTALNSMRQQGQDFLKPFLARNPDITLTSDAAMAKWSREYGYPHLPVERWSPFNNIKEYRDLVGATSECVRGIACNGTLSDYKSRFESTRALLESKYKSELNLASSKPNSNEFSVAKENLARFELETAEMKSYFDEISKNQNNLVKKQNSIPDSEYAKLAALGLVPRKNSCDIPISANNNSNQNNRRTNETRPSGSSTGSGGRGNSQQQTGTSQ